MLQSVLQNWLLVLLVALVITVLGVVAVLMKYLRLMLNILRDTPPPLLMGPVDFDRLSGNDVMFRAFDGTLLCGMFLSRSHLSGTADHDEDGADCLESNARGVVVFCHEYGADRYSCSRYCRGLLEAGYVVFAFDFRSHGQSAHLPHYKARLWCTDKEVSDVLGAVALVRNELEERQLGLPIVLFGISRGAGAAILAARQTRPTTGVRGIIADSAFSTDTVLEYSMKKWAHVFARVRIVYENHHPSFYRFLRWALLKLARLRFNCSFPLVRKALGQLKNAPIFFIHGEKDSYIRPEQTQKLFELARPPRHLWIVPNAKHNQSALVEPDRYTARIVGFMEKYVSGGGSRATAVAENYQQDVAEFFADDGRSATCTTTLSEDTNAQANHRIWRHPERGTPTETIRSEASALPGRAKQAAAEDYPR